jgi:8-oxo-dGTP diphosphatase
MPRPDNVGVGVAVLVYDRRKRKILLLQRKGAHAEGTWACPGGWVDFEDESPEAACLRELKEELDLFTDQKSIKLYTVVSENHLDAGFKSVTLYYILDWNNGAYNVPVNFPQVVEPDKSSDIKWISLNDLPSPLFPALDRVLKTF